MDNQSNNNQPYQYYDTDNQTNATASSYQYYNTNNQTNGTESPFQNQNAGNQPSGNNPKNNTPLYIIISVLATLLVVAIVAAVILLTANKTSDEAAETTTAQTTQKESVTETAKVAETTKPAETTAAETEATGQPQLDENLGYNDVVVPTTPSATTRNYSVYGYVLPNSDCEYISYNSLNALTAYECRIARNEIYARHGMIFETAEMSSYFNSCSWYVPTTSKANFSSSVFNKYEKSNIETIKAYETAHGYT